MASNTETPDLEAVTTYTNSSLATARACLRKYENKYRYRLELDTNEERETLAVGNTWHDAHEAKARGQDPYGKIAEVAPSPLWVVKLGRLFAAHAWYWRDDVFDIVEPEREFAIDLPDVSGRRSWTIRGKIDAVIRSSDGRTGNLEYKTTSDSVEPASDYWDRLTLDVQVGIYGAAHRAKFGRYPDFILYDVVRKPTINPKGLLKADIKRMADELAKKGTASYFGEEFAGEHVAAVLDADDPHESYELYGARLTADIGNRPGYYFGRRTVPRTSKDYEDMGREVLRQAELLELAGERGLLHRNPDACNAFGLCEYFRLCSHGIHPANLSDPAREGYRVREKEHPELSADLA